MNVIHFMMQVAELTAQQSTSEGTKVGAVLEKGGRVVSIGYNGTLPGKSNTCEAFIEACNCKIITRPTYPYDKCLHCGIKGKWVPTKDVIHAEQNVIAFAAKYGISTLDCTMYTTLSPCDTCAKQIVQAGISKVIFIKQWKDTTGLRLLIESNIDVHRYSITEKSLSRKYKLEDLND